MNETLLVYSSHRFKTLFAKRTCLVQKCHPLPTSAGFFVRSSQTTAARPNTMPKAATEATQTSMKHGVKS